MTARSDGGCLVFDSDSLANAGFPENMGYLRTEFITLETNDDVYLEFFQYYRNFESFTFLEILNTDGEVLNSFFLNEQVATNIETSKKRP